MTMHWDHTIDCIILGVLLVGALIVILTKLKSYFDSLYYNLTRTWLQQKEKEYGLELEKLRALVTIAEELEKGNRKGLNR